jgi:hypothetical protein
VKPNQRANNSATKSLPWSGAAFWASRSAAKCILASTSSPICFRAGSRRFAAHVEIAERIVGDTPDEVRDPVQIAVAHARSALPCLVADARPASFDRAVSAALLLQRLDDFGHQDREFALGLHRVSAADDVLPQFRVSEATNMRWSQVDLDAGVLHVARVMKERLSQTMTLLPKAMLMGKGFVVAVPQTHGVGVVQALRSERRPK